ncbi:G2/M phase-specific E3 ubiquitin-protein ligase-like isoform X6 [Montipora capricornis]|uniref:G2/M phase-specific E3 ubiquitin-protein ligase-like isoform X6 n=1 Tax=Montipora capricornis TaxID=246305 RepID=UPI0035F13369
MPSSHLQSGLGVNQVSIQVVYRDRHLKKYPKQSSWAEAFYRSTQQANAIVQQWNVLTQIFETLGKMIAHFLIQDGPGFLYLAPAIFWYISTGNLNEAVGRASPIDVVDEDLLVLLDKVEEAQPGYISELSKDSAFINFLQESGESYLLTESKLEVLQKLILHSTVFDQFRKGISIVGLLNEIEKNTEKFEPVFVHHSQTISPTFVKKLLKLPDESLDASVKSAVKMLCEFIDTASLDDLSDFLVFTTGSKVNTGSMRPGCIKVSVDGTEGFFASTCSFELKIPALVPNSADFQLL